MILKPFQLTTHNKHYEGTYTERDMKWRRICAIDKVNNIQSLLGEVHVDSVLEVGCGTGAVLAELAGRGICSKHIGVDLADPSTHADSNTDKLNLFEYDGKTLPFDNSSFDFVYASHVIEHVLNPRELLSEISRVSKNLIYIEVPCELHIRTSQKALQRTVDIGHINAYTPETFLLLLQTSGLNVQNLRCFDHSLEVHQFDSTKSKGFLKKMIRSTILNSNPILASKIFTYHCGALCKPIK